MNIILKLYGLFTSSITSVTEDYEAKQTKLRDNYKGKVERVVKVNTKKSEAYAVGISELQTAKSESDAETKQAESILKNLR